jgi:hypothetical protein
MPIFRNPQREALAPAPVEAGKFLIPLIRGKVKAAMEFLRRF